MNKAKNIQQEWKTNQTLLLLVTPCLPQFPQTTGGERKEYLRVLGAPVKHSTSHFVHSLITSVLEAILTFISIRHCKKSYGPRSFFLP